MKNCKCECGNDKDCRAKQCKSCATRANAKAQWQRMRPLMVASLIKSGAIRTGKHIKPKKPCQIDGCDQPTEARGWCHRHYSYWKLNGRPEPIRQPDEERFWSQVKKGAGCWEWQGSLNDNGYGMFQYQGRRERAHRVSYLWANGKWPMPAGRHTCDNPPCVRPDHIVEGTAKQNARDKVERNRQPRGSKVGGSKLTEADVLEIKGMLKQKVFQREIAAMFGVHQATIHVIATGRAWKHVKDELN
jgi:hypothetical protein